MKIKKLNEMAEYKDFDLIPLLDACDFPEDVEDELAGMEISTHYQNDVVGIWKWEKEKDDSLPFFKKWLLDTYGEKVREYRFFAIMST